MPKFTPVRITGLITILILLMLPFAAGTSSQASPEGADAKRFVGTWRAVQDNQIGIMIYDSLGNMAVQVMPTRPRKPYAGAQPTPDEAKDALTGYLAYFGTYTVDEKAHTITHHRKGSVTPGLVGQDAVRHYEFEPNDRLVLIPVDTGNRINWERAKGAIENY